MQIIKGAMITNAKVQKTIAEQKDTRNVMFLARHTDNKEVQESILNDNKEDKRILVALASNHELNPEIEAELAELAEKFPAIARALIARREVF